MERIQIHIDTATTSDITSSMPVVSLQNNNVFTGTYNLVSRNRCCRSISLKNAQIPIGFYNVRPGTNSITLGGTTYYVTPGNYTSVYALNAATLVGGAAMSSIGTFTLSGTLLVFSLAGGSSTTLTVDPNSLMALLGFVQSPTSSSQYTATYTTTFNWDTYISMFIENIGPCSAENYKITFKIPLSNVVNNVIYWDEYSQNEQKIQVDYNSSRINHLNYSFIDRFGNILNNNGVNWSATIEVEIE